MSGTPESPVLVARDHIIAPRTFSEAQWLVHLRDRLGAVVAEHHPEHAAIKGIERMPKPSITKLSPRIRAEGVALVACQALGLDPEIIIWMTIASRIGAEHSKKEYTEVTAFRGIEWATSAPEIREAIIVAAATLRREG